MGFVGNLLAFPAVKEFWKSVSLPWVSFAVFRGTLQYCVECACKIGGFGAFALLYRVPNKNLAIVNRSRVSCVHNTSSLDGIYDNHVTLNF